MFARHEKSRLCLYDTLKLLLRNTETGRKKKLKSESECADSIF
jgi:hypothetical protein